MKTIGLVFLVLSSASGAQSYTATSMNATAPIAGAVTPAAADAFVKSIGVNLHCESAGSPYVTQYRAAKDLLAQAGVRFVRSGGISRFCVSTIQDLYRTLGIQTDCGILPYLGNGVDEKFWMSPGGQYLAPYLKETVGTEAVASVEITNEVDSFYSYYRWHPGDNASLANSSTAPGGWGSYGPAIEAEAYKVMKGDPELASIPVYGPALGYYANGFANGSMYGQVDFGNMHPYPYGGNTLAYPASYGGIQRYFWQSDQPSVNIDEFPSAFRAYQPAFSSTAPGSAPAPMVATETGYFTGTAQRSVSLETQAKYIPRLVAEYFRHGIVRTFLYDFIDDGADPANSEDNYGLVTYGLTPKPAFHALQSLIALLRDPGANFTPSPLQYSLAVQANGAYTRTNYVHDLLLQKRDGTYYLLLWHEVSSAALAAPDGKAYAGTAVDLHPPALTTTIALPSGIASASLYTYDSNWQLTSSPLELRSGRIVLPATDRVSVIELVTARASPMTSARGRQAVDDRPGR
jgi:hypothetical protein